MDKITVVCHKDHVVSYEDYRGRCLLCLVEDLMREVGRLTAVCKEKEWVGLTNEEIDACDEESGLPQWEITTGDLHAFAKVIEAKLKEKNT